MSEILRDRGIKDPNEGLEEPRFRTVANFIFGGSRERMTELAFGDQKVDLTHGADNSHLHRCKDIEDWAKFILLNRRNTASGPAHNYDIVYGPIADDRVGVQLWKYENQSIDLQTLVNNLKYIKGMTFQYFFGTQEAIRLLHRK